MATVFSTGECDPESDAQILREAMDGIGTNEKDIIDVIARRTQSEREAIAVAYKQANGEDLVTDLKSELGNNFEQAVIALMTAPRKYDAEQIRAAMKGAGTDEACLIEILCTRSNDEINEIKEIYKTDYERDLEEDVQSETSGYFKRLLVSQINAGRDDSGDVDDDLAASEAQEIYEAGEEQWGTDEGVINKVVSLRNYGQLRATFDAYTEISGRDIEEAITSECSGTLEKGFLAIIQFAKNPVDFFAQRLYASMKGLTTDDDTLIRILVSRSEIDLDDIKIAYQVRYDQSLSNDVADDISGDYKRLMLKIIGD